MKKSLNKATEDVLDNSVVFIIARGLFSLDIDERNPVPDPDDRKLEWKENQNNYFQRAAKLYRCINKDGVIISGPST